MVNKETLPKAHPVKVLLDAREAAVKRHKVCMQTYHNARQNAIRHKAMAKEYEDDIARIDEALVAIMPKEDDDAGS